jgi:hypothetical protein
MKKLLLTSLAVVAFSFFTETKAQLGISLNLNIGARPAWGIPGSYAGDYYYLPDLDIYYYIPGREFIYWQDGDWLFASQLPYMYRDYDLFHCRKIIVNEPRPYLHASVYRTRYYDDYYRFHHPAGIAPRPGYAYGGASIGFNREEHREQPRASVPEWNRNDRGSYEQHGGDRGGDRGRFEQHASDRGGDRGHGGGHGGRRG